MDIAALILFFVISLALCLFIIGWLIYMQSISTISRKHPPYISTMKAVVKEIVKAFGLLSPNAHVYEIGSGDGRVLFALARANPEAFFTGIDKNLFPYLKSKYKLWRSGKSNIIFIKQDMYKISYAPATHIFTYLYPEAMNALLPKLEKELLPGTILISLDFPFAHKKPEHELDISHLGTRLGKKLFIYTF